VVVGRMGSGVEGYLGDDDPFCGRNGMLHLKACEGIRSILPDNGTRMELKMLES